MRHADGTVHFSDLKKFALSAAHYRESVTRERETSRVMRIGSLVDMMLLTTREPIVYPGKRQGAAWDAFKAKHAASGEDIYSEAEHDDARIIVAATREDPQAIDFLGLDDPDRRTQVPLRWMTNGIERSTRGIDVLTRGRLVDLKVTNSTHPDRFSWHARRMLWHAQLADYVEACAQNGIAIPGGAFLVGIESAPPYCVTVLHMSEGALLEGTKCIAAWIEQFKACEASNVWPGYVQSAVDLDFAESEDLVFPDDEDAAA